MLFLPFLLFFLLELDRLAAFNGQVLELGHVVEENVVVLRYSSVVGVRSLLPVHEVTHYLI